MYIFWLTAIVTALTYVFRVTNEDTRAWIVAAVVGPVFVVAMILGAPPFNA